MPQTLGAVAEVFRHNKDDRKVSEKLPLQLQYLNLLWTNLTFSQISYYPESC